MDNNLSVRVSKTIKYAVLNLILYSSFSLSASYVATFDTSAEGWFLNTGNSGVPVVDPMSYSGDGTTASLGCTITTTGSSNVGISGVSPSGTPYLTDVDSTGGASWYRSPDLGGLDLSGTIGGNFEFSSYTYQLGFAGGVQPNWMTGSGAPNDKFMKVQIEGTNGTIIEIDPATYIVPTATWEAGNWIDFSFPMDDVTWSGTMADLTAVLTSVKNIRIRAEFIFGGHTADCATTEYFALDEVKILEAFVPAPVLSITKVADDDTLVVLNQVINYTYVVTNTGNVVINAVTISDMHNGSGSAPVVANEVLTNTSGLSSDAVQDGSLDVLAPGDFATFTGTYTITQIDIDGGIDIVNTATTTGTPTAGMLIDPAVDESVTVSSNSSLFLDKQDPVNADEDGSTTVTLNDTLTYTIVATNNGTTTLNNVIISDPLITVTGGTSPCATLAPMATCTLIGTYQVDQDDVNLGNILNTATAGSDETPDEMDTVNTPTASSTSLSLDKQDPVNSDEDGSTTVTLNDTLTYTIVATNNGTTTLNNVIISDPLITVTGGTSPCATLAPMATCTLIGTYQVDQGDVDLGNVPNTATAISDEAADEMDSVNTPTAASTAQLTLLKTGALVGSGVLGDIINYTLQVTNTGNVTITDIVIVDAIADVGSIVYDVLDDTDMDDDIDSLAPGDSATVTAVHTINSTDVLAGQVVNTATTEGMDPLNNPISDVSDSTDPVDDTGGPSDPNVTTIAALTPAVIPVLSPWLLFLMMAMIVFVVRKYNHRFS